MTRTNKDAPHNEPKAEELWEEFSGSQIHKSIQLHELALANAGPATTADQLDALRADLARAQHQSFVRFEAYQGAVKREATTAFLQDPTGTLRRTLRMEALPPRLALDLARRLRADVDGRFPLATWTPLAVLDAYETQPKLEAALANSKDKDRENLDRIRANVAHHSAQLAEYLAQIQAAEDAGDPLVTAAVADLWRLHRCDPHRLSPPGRRYADLGAPGVRADVGGVEFYEEGPPSRPYCPADLDRATYWLALALAWPEVVKAWREDTPPSLSFRHPILGIGRGLGRRHGKEVGLPVKSDPAGGKVELFVPMRGKPSASLDLSLAIRARVQSRPDDFDADGTIKHDALLRWVREVTGPQISRMLAVGFALAELDAQIEGRPANGSFWWSPTRGADLLGYKRESNGKASKTRISKEATALVRSNFDTMAEIVIRHPVQWPGQKPQEFMGAFFSPLRATLDSTRRKHSQRGRDRQTLWQILPPLWEWSRKHYVATPIDLLNAGSDRPDVWWNCIRLYEVLAGYARYNPRAASADDGLLRRSLESLAAECNLWPDGRKANTAAALLTWAGKLQARGFLEGVEEAALADGKTPALAYRLPRERRTELAAVAGSAARKTLPPGGPEGRKGGGKSRKR